MKPSSSFDDFLKLIAILRKECPWDRKQTHHSIKDNLIEEAYEAVDAIDRGDFEDLSRELGDLLLHIVFQTRMAEENDAFTIEDVIYRISEKLIRRHPHVFDDVQVKNDTEVAQNWEQLKQKEGRDSILDGLPSHLPALIRGQRMQEKAANVGFDWAEWKLAWEKLDEELLEWKESIEKQSPQEMKDEFGDLLFSLVNVGRLLDIKAEDAMRGANRKFEERFRHIESRLAGQGRTLQDADLDEMDGYWNEAKTKSRS
ncbi:MAG: nucleoside triphosphate pyrophosphohydrolase [Balneolaceae bacterium]